MCTTQYLVAYKFHLALFSQIKKVKYGLTLSKRRTVYNVKKKIVRYDRRSSSVPIKRPVSIKHTQLTIFKKSLLNVPYDPPV